MQSIGIYAGHEKTGQNKLVLKRIYSNSIQYASIFWCLVWRACLLQLVECDYIDISVGEASMKRAIE